MPYPKRWTHELEEELLMMREGGISIEDCAKHFSVSEARICQIQRRVKMRLAAKEQSR